ncbi:FAD-dependent oxidoreductase [Ideonella sp.]|uniref:FAD-dependent oxidoreductase n=1 Tax=Ideonella sp. TaxID=1929293 RepID=UPI0035B0B8A6
MLSTYTYPRFSARRAPELDEDAPRRHPVVVVGAGPVGLAAAIDLAQRGLAVLLLDEDDTVSIGSRGVCYAQRTLEVLDRLGVAQPLVERGVTWNVGRTFFDTEEVFRFHLQPEAGFRRPGMINLQQYHLEEALVRRAAELPGLDLRWKHRVLKVEPHGQGATMQVETPEGRFTLEADWLVVADGARSPIRRQLGLDIEGQVFHDRFLIADVVMEAPRPAPGRSQAAERPLRGQPAASPAGGGADDWPAERWFWFDPPFHRGQSVLLHKQADRVWRIDFQLGWDADPEAEKQPERVIPRIQAMLAHWSGSGGTPPSFELEWVSVYTFQCRRMARFRHGRLLFVGDAAHQVSPFGARGANSGIQDTDNLAWKLQLVVEGRAPESLLDTYAGERQAAADENILNSTRSTDFITPKSPVSRLFRDAVLGLAREHAFARTLVNSGRLSVPTWLADSPLNTPDAHGWAGWMRPGMPAADAPVVAADGRPAWLLDELAQASLGHGGAAFTLLVFGEAALAPAELPAGLAVVRVQPAGAAAGPLAGERVLQDSEGAATRRYGAQDGAVYLLRPDQHVAARWRAPGAADVGRALRRALGHAEAMA